MRTLTPHPKRLTAEVAAALCVAGALLAVSSPAAGYVPNTWRNDTGARATGEVLLDVDAAGPHSAYAVGMRYTSDDVTDRAAAVVERWSPTGWHSLAQVPDADGLTSVDVRAPDDVWAGGFDDREYGGTRAWHYDGASWRKLTSRGLPSGFTGRILAVTHHVWLVGGVESFGGQHGAVIATYHGGSGARWTTKRYAAGSFDGAYGRTSRDAWAVGSTSPGEPSGRTLVARWHGTAWRLSSFHVAGTLTDVAADSAHSALAVGTTETADRNGYIQSAPLAIRWDGHRLARAATKCVCTGRVVGGGPADTYWTAGGRYERAAHGHWTATPIPQSPYTSQGRSASIQAMSRIPGTTRTLAVGCEFSCLTSRANHTPIRQETQP